MQRNQSQPNFHYDDPPSLYNHLNEEYVPKIPRYAPRFKPFSLNEVEAQDSKVYPFRQKQSAIENTYVNVMPHSTPSAFTHQATGFGYPGG